MKRAAFFICTIFLFISSSWGQTTWNLTPTMTATSDNGVLTISTTKTEGEAMPDYSAINRTPWGSPNPGPVSYFASGGFSLVVIEDNVTTIGSCAFHGCGNLTSVIIPNSVVSIGAAAFANCISLADVTVNWQTPISASIIYPHNSIAPYTNTFDKSRTVLFVPTGTKALYQAAPGWREFGSIDDGTPVDRTWNLSDNMTATLDVNGVLTISANEKSEAMQNYSFELYYNPATGDPDYGGIIPPWYGFRSKIRSILIGNKVTTVGEGRAFNDCPELTSILIPNSAVLFNSSSLQYCSALKDITVEWAIPISSSFDHINASMITLHVPTGTKAIYEASSGWKDFGTIIDEGAPPSDKQTWFLTSTMTATLNYEGVLKIMTTKEKETMPNYRDINGGLAGYKYSPVWYWVNSRVLSAVIENGVTSIGNNAFQYCSKLTSVSISNSVTNIGGGAFAGCSDLNSVLIPNSITTIEVGAFGGCGFTSINIPNSVTNIGGYTFYGCKNLTDVIVNWANPLTINSSVFQSLNLSVCTLHVPIGTKSLYEKAEVWKEFGTIVEQTPPEIVVTGVSLDKTAASLVENNTLQLIATVSPSDATNQNVRWSSSNELIATVSESGLVTAKAAGTAIIVVTTVDGGFTATCTVTVTAAVVSVTGVSLDKTTASLVEKNTLQLNATVSPSNATNQNVRWSSSNESVATVSESGLVTAKAAGTAIIVVTTVDGGFTATCTVTVTAAVVPVTGISLDKTSLTMWVAESEQLNANISPESATNKNIRWSSSNESVAEVSTSGLVTAKAAGTTVIIATTVDGGFTAMCNVDVRKQEIEVDDDAETDDDGKGKIVLSLTIPADVLFSGTFQLMLPDGVKLDLSVTHLADDLASQLTLTIEQKADGSWIFTITPNNLRSAMEMVYSRIVEIGYMVDETVAQGTYQAVINDLSFEFENGATIAEKEIPVNITVNNSSTGIPKIFDDTYAYINSGRLYINSPVTETVQVYSISGVLLYKFLKQEGKVNYPIDKTYNSILIVKGSSGWVRKVIMN